MTEISRLNELTYNHPFTVSNAVLRIQVNIEKIKLLMRNFADADEAARDGISDQIGLLDNEINEDFNIINERFLGSMDRFNNAYSEYKAWRDTRESIIRNFSRIDNVKDVLRKNPSQIDFTREMEYLSRFAENKAAEFLNSSRLNAKTSITIAYILFFFFIVLGMIMLFSLIQSIKTPMDILMHAVEDIQEGRFNQKVYILNGGREFVQLADAFNRMTGQLNITYSDLENKVTERTESLAKILDERNLLIRELYHRTKNNMQVISSIISMQADDADNPQLVVIMKELENKIQSMALVHQMLYKSDDLSHIYLDDYIDELIALIGDSFYNSNLDIQKNIQLDHIPLLLDFAVPCGLILNELLTNSMKYAFPETRSGTITITARKKEKGVIIIDYSDDGIGLPDEFSFEDCQTMGFLLIKTIAEHQLNGFVDLNGKDGINCRIEFVDTTYRKRI